MDESMPNVRWPYKDTSQNSLLLDLHSTTTQLRAGLEEVQTAILRQQALLSELHRQQQELERRLGLVVYPVLTLPNEIVSRIFVHCLPSHGRVRPSHRTAPLLLAQICRRWRDIALETCELWSSLDLTSERNRTGMDRFLPAWISRGKQHSLSLSLRGDAISPLGVGAFIVSVGRRLWRLELSFDWIICMDLANTRTSFPNLRQLALYGFMPSYFFQKPAILAFSDAPLLCELKIGHKIGLLKLDLYPSLTTLDIQTIPSTLLSILQQLPQLLHVTASLKDDDSSGPATIAPSLRSFILYGRCPDILDFLTLPALRRLEVNEVDSLPYCLEFFERSACALDHLSIYAQDTDELTAYLDVMPTVTSLRIDMGYDMSLLARTLTATPLLVPRLATLVLDIFEFQDYHLSLVDLLRERFAHGLASAKVHLANTDSWLPPADCLGKLNELISCGMDVELRNIREYWKGGEYYARRIEPIDPCETFP